MNETIQNIVDRRSIRHYLPDPIGQADLEQIIDAGLYAPSMMGRQARQITVLRDVGQIAELGGLAREALTRLNHPYAAYASKADFSINFNAPVFVILSGDKDAEVDCALVLENLFIAAKSLGIGSCWIHLLNDLWQDDEFRRRSPSFGIAANDRVYGAAALGYAAHDWPIADPRRPDSVTWL